MIEVQIEALSFTKRKVYYAGETSIEAKEKGLNVYIGHDCKGNHTFFDRDGNKIKGAVRYTCNRSCVKCSKLSNNKSRYNKNEPGGNTCKSRIEDIKLAKELGISIDDL